MVEKVKRKYRELYEVELLEEIREVRYHCYALRSFLLIGEQHVDDDDFLMMLEALLEADREENVVVLEAEVLSYS